MAARSAVIVSAVIKLVASAEIGRCRFTVGCADGSAMMLPVSNASGRQGSMVRIAVVHEKVIILLPAPRFVEGLRRPIGAGDI